MAVVGEWFGGVSPYASEGGVHPWGWGLPGRRDLLQGLSSHLSAVSRGEGPDHVVVTGPSGVGKTAFLDACVKVAQEQHFTVIEITHSADSVMQDLAQGVSGGSSWWRKLKSSLGVGLKAGFGVVGVDASVKFVGRESGGGVDAVAAGLGRVARSRGRGGVLLVMDEMDQFSSRDLLVVQEVLRGLGRDRRGNVPVVFVGAGHAGVREMMPRAVGGAVRFVGLGCDVGRQAVAETLCVPARARGRDWDQGAVDAVYEVTRGHPGFVQIVADQVWGDASSRVISRDDVARSAIVAYRRFADAYVVSQWRRLDVRQRDYVSVVALHRGACGDKRVAAVLGAPWAEVVAVGEQLARAGVLTYRGDGRVELCDSFLASHVRRCYPHLAGQRVLAGVERGEIGQVREAATRSGRGRMQAETGSGPALIDELVVRAARLGAVQSRGVRGPVWGRGDSGRER